MLFYIMQEYGETDLAILFRAANVRWLYNAKQSCEKYFNI